MRKEHGKTTKVNLREGGDNLGDNYARKNEEPHYLQVKGRGYPCGSKVPPIPYSIPPYYFEGKHVKGSRTTDNDPVRMQISELADKETALLILDRMGSWIRLSWDRLTDGEEDLDEDDAHGHQCVYEVRDDAGGHDEYSDEKLVAIYANRDDAEELAEQIGGYVRRVSE